MSEYSSPYLCGGTFFNLLLEAKTNSTYIRSSLTNEYEKNTEVSLLKRLVSIFNDDLPSYKEDTDSPHLMPEFCHLIYKTASCPMLWQIMPGLSASFPGMEKPPEDPLLRGPPCIFIFCYYNYITVK